MLKLDMHVYRNVVVVHLLDRPEPDGFFSYKHEGFTLKCDEGVAMTSDDSLDIGTRMGVFDRTILHRADLSSKAGDWAVAVKAAVAAFNADGEVTAAQEDPEVASWRAERVEGEGP